jgi:xanthine dehydrogenase/oxidase
MMLTTIEGLGNVRDGMHPVQVTFYFFYFFTFAFLVLIMTKERIAMAHGSQCGFCTPGIAMALYAYLRSHPKATMKDIEENFDGIDYFFLFNYKLIIVDR